MRIIAKLFGTILILGGLGLLVYAGYTYLQVQRVAMLPANLPAFDPSTGSLGAPTLPAPPTSLPTATLLPTIVPATLAPTITPLPSPSPTPAPGPVARLLIRGTKVKKDLQVKDAGWVTTVQNGQSFSDWDIPFDAVGHHMNTPNPGETGNSVISGHHNLIGPNKFGVGLFAYNWNIGPGDKLFTVDAAGKAFEFTVQRSYPLLEAGQPVAIREQHAIEAMGPTADPSLTLITCWAGPENPFSSNTYRWIVRAKLDGKVDPKAIPPLPK